MLQCHNVCKGRREVVDDQMSAGMRCHLRQVG